MGETEPNSQIFADFLYSISDAQLSQKTERPQTFAKNRRKPQHFAETHLIPSYAMLFPLKSGFKMGGLGQSGRA